MPGPSILYNAENYPPYRIRNDRCPFWIEIGPLPIGSLYVSLPSREAGGAA